MDSSFNGGFYGVTQVGMERGGGGGRLTCRSSSATAQTNVASLSCQYIYPFLLSVNSNFFSCVLFLVPSQCFPAYLGVSTSSTPPASPLGFNTRIFPLPGQFETPRTFFSNKWLKTSSGGRFPKPGFYLAFHKLQNMQQKVVCTNRWKELIFASARLDSASLSG